jgi:ADYC domain-containing protein
MIGGVDGGDATARSALYSAIVNDPGPTSPARTMLYGQSMEIARVRLLAGALLTVVATGCLANAGDVERSGASVSADSNTRHYKSNGTLLNSARLSHHWSVSRLSGRGPLGQPLQRIVFDNGQIKVQLSAAQGLIAVPAGTVLWTEDATFKITGTSLLPTLAYQLQVREGESWVNACEASPLVAVLSGWWNTEGTGAPSADEPPDAFTFACLENALGKCSDVGYTTWYWGGLTVDPYHSACTRLIRGDYCGINEATTLTGMTVDLWDNANINTNDPNIVLPFEAEWGPNGAACVAQEDLDQMLPNGTSTLREYLQGKCPGVLGASLATACGQQWTTGLLMNESNRY